MTQIKHLLQGYKKGFTLVEIVLYIALSTVVLTLTFNMMYSLVRLRTKDKIKRDVDSELIRVEDVISQKIRNAREIEIQDSLGIPVTSGFGERLVIDVVNIDNSTERTVFYSVGTDIKADIDTEMLDLNSSFLNISNLRFRYLSRGVFGETELETIETQFSAEYAHAGSEFFEYSRDINFSVKLR